MDILNSKLDTNPSEIAAVSVEFAQLVWEQTFYRSEKEDDENWTSVDTDGWELLVSKFMSNCGKGLFEFAIDMLKEIKNNSYLFDEEPAGGIRIATSLQNPVSLLANLSGASWLPRRSLLQYHIWSYVRHRYGLRFCPEVVRSFHAFAQALSNPGSDEVQNHSFETLPTKIGEALVGPGQKLDSAKIDILSMAEALILAGRITNLIRVRHESPRSVDIEPSIDAEYLLSQLFGMRSDIPGFDLLFGGGGILMGEVSGKLASPPIIPGRVIVIKGQSGAGKTSLALNLAAEAAKKGGFAWYFPLEQSASECKMYLEMFSLVGTAKTQVEICDTARKIIEIINRPRGERPTPRPPGAVLLSSASKRTLDNLLDDVVEASDLTKDIAGHQVYIVDPVNSILDLSTRNPREMRAQLVKKIAQFKERGANLVLAAEPEAVESEQLAFLENVADVVISLESSNVTKGYSQRYFRILKSRLQREQRGPHAYSIKAGLGLEIYPSSPAIAATVRTFRLPKVDREADFGWSGLNSVLGGEAFVPGDLIVIEGESGGMKTQFGILFARQADPEEPRKGRLEKNSRSLILALGDRKATILHLEDRLKQPRVKTRNELIIEEGLATGYIQPGKIFQTIENSFDGCVAGTYIDRAWIDNLWRWERECPSVQEDQTFGQTLIEYLRKRRVTTLVTCRDLKGATGGLQKGILDSANVHIRLWRQDFKGTSHLLIRVIKTRGMKHRREDFVLDYNGDDQLSLAQTWIELTESSDGGTP